MATQPMGDPQVQYAVVQSDGRVWTRVLYREQAEAIAARNSHLPDVGPLHVEPEPRDVQCRTDW